MLFSELENDTFRLNQAELINEIILCFFTKIFFFSFGKKSQNTPNSIFRANIRNLLLRVDASDFHFVHAVKGQRHSA
jgi:hypothetical protein